MTRPNDAAHEGNVRDARMDNLWKFLSDVRSLLILAGLILFALGLVGQITGYIPEMALAARLAAIVVGIAVALTGIWLVFADLRKNVRGIRILDPPNGKKLPERVPLVRGEIQDDIPDGKELWLLRIYPKHNMFVPLTAVHVRSDKTWEVEDCYLGGKPGEKRYIGAYIVDETAVTLFTLFFDASKQHNKWMDDLEIQKGADKRHLEPIKGDPAKMENMKVGHEVEVERDESI
jgi:hypothetical protein